MREILFVLLFSSFTSLASGSIEVLSTSPTKEDYNYTVADIEIIKNIVSNSLIEEENRQPIDCAFYLGTNPCSNKNYEDSFSIPTINTPQDVYCFTKKRCCEDKGLNNENRLRNREYYCECKANHMREKSYELQDINYKATIKLMINKNQDNCANLYDYYWDLSSIYNMVYSLCKSQNITTEQCDKFSQIVQQTIRQILAKKITDSNQNIPFVVDSQLGIYESEYQKLTNNEKFKTLMTKKSNQN